MTRLCRNGHAYTPENTYTAPQAWKACRTCRDERRRDWARGVRKADRDGQPVTDESLFALNAVTGSEKLLTALMLYGARNGGLPNIPADYCREWLQS